MGKSVPKVAKKKAVAQASGKEEPPAKRRSSSRHDDPNYEVGAPVTAHFNACIDEAKFKGKVYKIWPKDGEWAGYYSVKFDDDGSLCDKVHWNPNAGVGHGLVSAEDMKIKTPVRLEGATKVSYCLHDNMVSHTCGHVAETDNRICTKRGNSRLSNPSPPQGACMHVI